MPTYEYRCEAGHHFERAQKMSEKPVSKCPVCGAKASRIISGGQGLIFKGSGFYITDYGKDGKGPRKEPSATTAPTESSSSPKSEGASAAPTAKPESKGETKPAGAAKPGKSDIS